MVLPEAGASKSQQFAGQLQHGRSQPQRRAKWRRRRATEINSHGEDESNDTEKDELTSAGRVRAIFCNYSLCAVALLCSANLISQQKPSETSSPSQKTFATPKEAADAFVQAAGTFDVPALEQILGPGSEDLVASEDLVRDRNLGIEFANKAREKNSVVVDPKNAKRATLVVGNDDWPLPIPIVQRNGRWLFDTKAGRQEILYRRIGSNELDAIEICRGYVEAQHEYAMERHDGSKVNQYAQVNNQHLGKARRIGVVECGSNLGWANRRGHRRCFARGLYRPR